MPPPKARSVHYRTGPTPRNDVQCGPTSMPDVGCTDEKNDVIAAYTHALLWYYTGQKPHATKAIEIMKRLVGRARETFARQRSAAGPLGVRRFSRAPPKSFATRTPAGSTPTCKNSSRCCAPPYLPEVKDGSTRTGNWDTSATDAALSIAVFLNDHAEFDEAIALWRARTPRTSTSGKDGASPLQPPREPARSSSALASYWWNPKQFVRPLAGVVPRSSGRRHARLRSRPIRRGRPAQRRRDRAHSGRRLVSARAGALHRVSGAALEISERRLHQRAVQYRDRNVGADPMWDLGYNAYANVLGQRYLKPNNCSASSVQPAPRIIWRGRP